MDQYFNEDYIDSNMFYNKVNFESFNVEKFNESYQIVELRREIKGNYYNSPILGDLARREKILAVKYSGCSSTYLLLDRNSTFDWKELLSEEKYEEFSKHDFVVREEDKNNIEYKMDIVYSLLLNALAKRIEGVSNLNGWLYILAKATDTKKIMMKYRVAYGLLEREQQTFVLAKYKKNAEMKYVFEDCLNGASALVRQYILNKDNEDELFVMGSFNKSGISFDDLYKNSHKLTRTDLYQDIVKNFNKEYKDIAQFEFEQVECKTKQILDITKMSTQKENEIKQLKEVNLIVAEGANDKVIVNCVVETLEEFGLVVHFVNDVDENALNIVMIRDKEYYKEQGEMDAKFMYAIGLHTQCIQLETLKSSKSKKEEIKKEIKPKIKHVLNELIVKQDVKNGRFGFRNWEFGDYKFLCIINDNKLPDKKTIHCLMSVNENGEFTFDDHVSTEILNKYMPELKYRNNKLGYRNGNVCVVIKGNDHVLVKHTDYLPIVDRDKRIALDGISNKTRTKKRSYLNDKEAYPYEGKSVMLMNDKYGKNTMVHYTVGGSNIFANIATVNNIYCIEKQGDMTDERYLEISKDIVTMLEDIHVRSNNAESVRPFVFKYILEYMRAEEQVSELALRD